MRILIVDDTKENLEAAKQASVNFPEHEFLFTNSAEEATMELAETDALITDLFFPDENHKNYDCDRMDFILSYNNFYRMLSSMQFTSLFKEVVQKYYNNNLIKAEEKHIEALELASDGTIRNALENLIRDIEKQGRDANEWRESLNNLPTPQFPYGGALILRAKEFGKDHCLISDIHRHAGSYKNAPSAIEGMALLLPLMYAGIISVEQAMYDGKDSLTYLGGDEIYRFGKGKNDPAVWLEAIRRTTRQKGGDK